MISFAPIILLLIYLVLFGFIAYFLISVLQFMRTKIHNDRLLLQKFDELSQKIDELSKDESKESHDDND